MAIDIRAGFWQKYSTKGMKMRFNRSLIAIITLISLLNGDVLAKLLLVDGDWSGDGEPKV